MFAAFLGLAVEVAAIFQLFQGWEWSRSSPCDPSPEAPPPACRGSWRPIATAASDRPSSRASNRSSPPEASGPSSSTEGSPRPCGAPSRSESRGPADPSDRVRSCFGRPSSRARRPRSRRSRPPSPRQRHSTVGLARQARNEVLQIGYGGAIIYHDHDIDAGFEVRNSPKQPIPAKSQSRFTCFWPSP